MVSIGSPEHMRISLTGGMWLAASSGCTTIIITLMFHRSPRSRTSRHRHLPHVYASCSNNDPFQLQKKYNWYNKTWEHLGICFIHYVDRYSLQCILFWSMTVFSLPCSDVSLNCSYFTKVHFMTCQTYTKSQIHLWIGVYWWRSILILTVRTGLFNDLYIMPYWAV